MSDLLGVLESVVRERDPDAAAALRGETAGGPRNPRAIARALQAQGQWFHLLALAEQYAAFRARRESPDASGTFNRVIQDAKERGVSRETIESCVAALRIVPVITAHPTEARRVTVLEKYRRIYECLERSQFGDLTDEIDLLWLTGELRLAKPTVEQEIAWGLYFFSETLFDTVSSLEDRLAQAVRAHYPDATITPTPFIEFGSWIGGDRDGNPFVTPEVTRHAIRENRLASLRRYEQRLTALRALLSISQESVRTPLWFERTVADALTDSGQGTEISHRNPNELFRQYLSVMLWRLPHYATADDLVADLRVIERALDESQCAHLARSLIAPVRREVEIFRFATARLDLR